MAVKVKRAKCPICTHRPVKEGESYCSKCLHDMAVEARKGLPARTQEQGAKVYFTWQGITVGFFPSTANKGMFTPKMVFGAHSSFPKSKFIDLNVPQPGWSREQKKKIIKTMKYLNSRSRG